MQPLQQTRVVTTIAGAIGLALIMMMAPQWFARPFGRDNAVMSRRYATHTGQRMAVTLGDGSSMILAPETRVRYTVDSHGQRFIDLMGEAFFTVAPATHHPFIVRTGTVTTRVLGTTFDVQRYGNDPATLVTVISGRVTAGGHTSPVIVSAGTLGRLTDSTATVTTLGDAAAQTVSWTRGNLVFTHAPVSAILATLGRWYGYEFRLTDTTVARWQVSAEFRADHLAETLNILKTILEVTMSVDGNVITLRSDPGAHTPAARRTQRELLENPEPEVGK